MRSWCPCVPTDIDSRIGGACHEPAPPVQSPQLMVTATLTDSGYALQRAFASVDEEDETPTKRSRVRALPLAVIF